MEAGKKNAIEQLEEVQKQSKEITKSKVEFQKKSEKQFLALISSDKGM